MAEVKAVKNLGKELLNEKKEAKVNLKQQAMKLGITSKWVDKIEAMDFSEKCEDTVRYNADAEIKAMSAWSKSGIK